ncbi:DNA annealing helicase and endonuclease ZRANB3 isoform X1 [Acipenser ruthenus]|uniref:DNA annealing helicase and endonuclease ZRANB3 isoform X1 n=1 Tax=Acipenser ruthenus TaxID=7906 RepID=UPI00274104B6|nr:DNA annealing helicase and endonuclease ZRANB3 isoform X1 [Acipenser ruthenus]XP_033900529.3 DNA annealing helicase and endonuclease ZRANB3 isoform X1 [Acipenser ruthenus]XP_058889851.1 DNA annealing helicase and endonuclease ZRANB3 isoform X1 [Acipenser ruthenus]
MHPSDREGVSCTNKLDNQLLVLPEKLRQRLMPFQKEGVKFAISRNGRCMIADEMGLGKTIQAISVAYFYKQEWPLLIVVPSSLKYPWIEEMEKWIPELNPDDINLIDNKVDIGRISTSKVTVLGYGLLTSDAKTLVDALHKQKFQVIVVDESHYLKSRNAARSKILVPIVQKAARAILLTGTPALGRPEELFMQIDALYPRRFGTWIDFAKKYCNAHVRFFGQRRQWDSRGASNLDELHQRLSKIMIRRMKDQVLTQLPPKIRQRIPFDLPKEGAKEATASFEEWEKLMRALDSGTTGTDNSFVEVMGLITRMYKQTAIAKAGAVKDYIKMMLENEKLKFLVFAHHLTMLQACTEAVIEAKVRYIRIDGSVPSSERIHLVHQFQNDPDTRVAVLSIQAAGQGLTFTAATHVVFAELYWNPGHIKQAEDRAHRIGQCSSVHIHYLIAKGTFDTVMWGMLNRKAKVTGSTLNGKKEHLKADVGDKEKWDFLNFASAWTPSETLHSDLLDSKDEVFFSHFEKEKQHDIRTFFSPRAGKENKRKRPTEESPAGIPNDEDKAEMTILHQSVEEGTMTKGGSQEIADEEILEIATEPQSKRMRHLSQPMIRNSGKQKRKSWAGKASSPVSLQRSQRVSEGASLLWKKLPAVEREWNCISCTYTNSSLLPYCEVCETRRDSSSNPSKEESQQSNKATSEKEQVPEGLSQTDCLVISDTDSESDSNTRTDPEQTNEMEMEKQKPEKSQCNKSPSQNIEDETVCESDNASAPVYEGLMFCASRNTDRIYLYTKDGDPLNCNFIPLDVKLENWEDLPDIFENKKNRIQILRFVQEWSSLTAMKQRVLRKTGRIFRSPVLVLEDITKGQRRQSCTKRYLTKEDVVQASLGKAQKDGGSVRVVCKENVFSRMKVAQQTNAIPARAEGESVNGTTQSVASSSAMPSQTAADSQEKGYLQALDAEGNPLCLCCQLPSLQVNTAWDTRFCSQRCQEEFLVRSNQSYMRAKVFETERGVCQQCNLHAQELYQRIKDAPRVSRKDILENTWMSQLSLNQLNEMIRNPTEGLFWQVDHIRPVYGGGGQCSLDNLQTLCTVCHKERTAKQAKERSQMKKTTAASKLASDISRFFIKK